MEAETFLQGPAASSSIKTLLTRVFTGTLGVLLPWEVGFIPPNSLFIKMWRTPCKQKC